MLVVSLQVLVRTRMAAGACEDEQMSLTGLNLNLPSPHR